MKAKWLPILLILLPYPVLAGTIWLFAGQGALDLVFLPLALMAVAGTVPNGIYALRLSVCPGAQEDLVRWTRRIKLGHVPFYLLLFLLCILLAVSVVGLLVLPLMLVLLYAALLPASLYGLDLLHLARQQGRIAPRQARIRAVELFVPGLDIVAALELCSAMTRPAGEE